MNIMDVVRLSGVSKSTVSRVINNYPHISKEKRQRVLEAMEELGYIPNPSARRLRGNLTTTVGVVVNRIVNPFFSYLVDAIEKVGYETGYQTLIFQSKDDKQKELAFMNLLKTKQVDGIIMTALENDWEDIRPFTQYGPIVLCNEYFIGANVPIIRLNQFKGAYMGVRHLIDKGHHKIAYCTGSIFTEFGKDKDRNRGYQQALEEAGIAVNPAWIMINRRTIDEGMQVLQEIIEMKERPTAVFTGSDEVAAGVLLAARRHGCKVPEDLAVVGFDDQPFAKTMYPELTTVRQPVDAMGKKAMEVLIELMSKDQEYRDCAAAGVTYELPIELVVRKST